MQINNNKLSPSVLSFLLLILAALVELSRPLQPIPHHEVRCALLEVGLFGEGFGLPDVHVVGHLLALQLADFAAGEVGHKVGDVEIVEHYLEVAALGADVVVED